MKKLLLCATAIGFLVLAGCSGSSPTPGPVPTPPGQAWAITSLTFSSSQPMVGEEILVEATVTQDGSAAPDGTTVTFSVSGNVACYDDATKVCAGFQSAAVTEASVATTNGRAAAYFVALQEGTFVISARVSTVTKSGSVYYKEPDQTDDLHIYSVVPSQGSLAGGEEVIFTGKGVYTPVEVYFVVSGTSYQAQVLSVLPGSAEGSIRVKTPAITGVDTTKEYQANVRIVRGVGTAYEQEETLTAPFSFTPTSADPEIYELYPDHGSARGGDQVTILGRNFEAPVRVTFATSQGTLEADEVTVSSDGTQISLITPQVSANPLQEDVSATVNVVSRAGSQFEKTASKQNGFTFVADQPKPNITSISPTSGPIEGGTRVTIFGTGFTFPVQVFFSGGGIGNHEANVISVSFTEVIVTTPDITSTEPTPPVTVAVTVRNVESGLEGTLSNAFTYGENLFISGNSPTEGGEGTVVTIFGRGFRDPLLVDWGSTRVETISVSGSEVLVRMPALVPVPCGDTTATFTVTHPDSNMTATGGSFTYFGNSPRVLSVDPFTVQETSGGDGVDPGTVTIHGSNFSDQLTVSIKQGGNTYVVPPSDVTVVDSNTITIVLPAPNTFNLVWDTSQCVIADAPVPGSRRVATPVNVTVTNVAGNCSDTLQGGLVYQPESSDCELGAVPDQTSLAFADTPIGSCSSDSAKTLTITNYGSVLVTWTVSPPANPPFTLSGTLGGSLNPGESATLDVSFCPTTANAGSQFFTSTLTITSNDTDPTTSPVSTVVTLTGTALAPVLDVQPTTTIDFGSVTANAGGTSCATPVDVTISNIGQASMDWTSSGLAAPFSTASTASGTLAAGASATVTLDFCPTVAGTFPGTFKVDGTISGGVTPAVGSPKNVPLTGTGTP